MTDKIKSEDFIKAFGSGVGAKVENIPMKLEVNSPIVIDCKYYLPCGRCDKTNEICQMLGTNVTGFYIPVNNNGTVPIKNNEQVPSVEINKWLDPDIDPELALENIRRIVYERGKEK